MEQTMVYLAFYSNNKQEANLEVENVQIFFYIQHFFINITFSSLHRINDFLFYIIFFFMKY